MPANYNDRTVPLAQGVNTLSASMRLAYDLTGHDTRPRWQAYDSVGGTTPTMVQSNAPTTVTYNGVPGVQFAGTAPVAQYDSTTDFGIQVGTGDFTACVLVSTPSSLPTTGGSTGYIRLDNAGSAELFTITMDQASGLGWVPNSSNAGTTLTIGTGGRAYVGVNRTIAVFFRKAAGVASTWRVVLGTDGTALRVNNDSTVSTAATSDFNSTNARRIRVMSIGPTALTAAESAALHSIRFHNVAFTEAEMLTYANSWWEMDTFVGAPVITGPTGAAGATSSTSTGGEGSVTGPTFTTSVALGSGYPTLTGPDASLFAIVPLTSTSWRVDHLVAPNFEAPTDVGANNVYDFTFNASATVLQTHARTITNLPELSLPTRATPTSTTVAPGFTTDAATGTARGIVIRSATQPATPLIAQVKDGLNAAGTNAGVTVLPNLTITSAGAKQFAPATVAAGGTDWPFIVHTDSGGNDSLVHLGLPHYPGTGRAVADVSVAGWTVTGAASGAAAINEDASNRSTFIMGPVVSGSPALATYQLDKPYPPGTYSFSFDVDMVSGTGQMRLKLFDDAGTLLGTGAYQALTTTPTVFTFNVTVAGGTATRWGFESIA